MLEIINLTKSFDTLTAVDHISFSVGQGETLVLLGTSGCGKTTTLKMINRLIEPTEGDVYIDGKNVLQQKPETLRKRIGYVIQNIGLFPHYTVEQNIAIVPNLLKWDKDRIASRVHELLKLVGLPSGYFLQRKPAEISGGQKQRVGLARALAADPSIVLMDEPFGALDPITRRQIQKEFKQLETLLHKTMILVTHDVFEAVELGDRICLMDRGKIQQIGPPRELIFKPGNDFVKDFFQANRFQLELMVLTLKDIINDLPKKQYPGGAVQTFSEDQSLLDVLETMGKIHQKETILSILKTNQESGLHTTSEALLYAFYKKRTRLLQ